MNDDHSDKLSAAAIGIKKICGYKFKNLEILENALTHPSAAKESYQRLEFVGDKILAMFIACKIFEMYPTAEEGDLTLRFVSLTKGSVLADMAFEFSLHKYIFYGAGEEKAQNNKRKALEDVFEALIGAIFIDGGFLAAKKVINKLFENKISFLEKINKDSKSTFQELLQKKFRSPPKYHSYRLGGEDHKPVFFVYSTVHKLGISFFAIGKSIKDAQREVASNAVDYIQTMKLI